MTRELKHLAPYLPFNLKYVSPRHIGTHIMDFSKEESIEVMSVISLLSMTKDESKYKPILRPLSDLANEIEIDGEKFIPMVELLKMIEFPQNYTVIKYSSKLYDSSISKGWFSTIEYMDSVKQVNSFSYDEGFRRFITRNETQKRPIGHAYDLDLFQKLFQWHFDVFGLIKNELAIDINNLKNI